LGTETLDTKGEDREDQADETPADDGEDVFELEDDPDAVDTAPTRIESEAEETPSGRHEVVVVDEPVSARMSIHLPLDDPDEVPEGYQIKADTKLGLYWAPDSALYESARAELWLASEEFARTNGFERADEPRP
jgi:uncharacterized protein with LGFP repeats